MSNALQAPTNVTQLKEKEALKILLHLKIELLHTSFPLQIINKRITKCEK